MATLVFIDTSFLGDFDARPRCDSSVIPRAGDWVQIPADEDDLEDDGLMFQVDWVLINYQSSAESREVWVYLGESRTT